MVHDLKTIIALNEIEHNFSRVEFRRYSGVPTEGVNYVCCYLYNGEPRLDMCFWNRHNIRSFCGDKDGFCIEHCIIDHPDEVTIIGELHLKE